MARMGTLNFTVPEGEHGTDRWLILAICLLTFAGEMFGDQGLTCRATEPRFDIEDCERVCYGRVAEASLTGCKCQTYADEE